MSLVQTDSKTITQDVFIKIPLEKLTKEDYYHFVQKIEQLITYEKIKMLFALKYFGGWSESDSGKYIKFEVNYFEDNEQVAIVGNKMVENQMADFCKICSVAKTKFYNHDEIEDKKNWIKFENL
jgi:hypothetical protein